MNAALPRGISWGAAKQPTRHHTAQSFALALRGADGREGPFYSVDAKGEKPQFSWNEADVLNWNTEKPYDF